MQRQVTHIARLSQSQLRRFGAGVLGAESASPPRSPPSGGAWKVSFGSQRGEGGGASLTGMSPVHTCLALSHSPPATMQDSFKMAIVSGALGLISTLVVLETRLENSLGKRADQTDAKIDEMKSDFDAKLDRLEDKMEAKLDKLEAKMESKFNRADDRYTEHLRSLVKSPVGEGPKSS